MADVNDPSDQSPTMDPPVRTDDQILPHIRWIPIGKSNCYLDLEKSQSNPIYKIAVDLLKNTNFFRAFTASSNLPSIYVQQFWDTILYDKKAKLDVTSEKPLDMKDQGPLCYRFYGALSQEPILIMPRGSGSNLPNPYILLLKTNRICLDIHQGKEGHFDCDSKRSVHQADHPSSSEEAQVPPKTRLSTPPV
nr:hypothetical protein [Tanacetum cinerariifolium]